MRSMKKAIVAGMVVLTGAASTGALEAQSRRPGGMDASQRAALETARYQLEMARPQLAGMGAEVALAAPALAAARSGLAAARAQLAGQRFERSDRRSARALGPVDVASEPPEAWLQEDPGGPLYESARESLNRRRYAEAAEQFGEIRERFPRSGYVADSYYWQAFALFREGGNRRLREASALLEMQADDHPDAGTRRDADALAVRIEAQLARGGDADAAAEIARQASGPCDEQQEVRMAALSALLNMNAEQAVPILQEVLESRDDCSVELRRRAVFLISQKMTDESVDILLDLAHRDPDPDPEVREQAIFWLHQVRTPEALEALESILIESDDPELQERAIFAISQRSDDGRAIQVLRSYAERTDVPTELRSNAIFWISQNPDAGGVQYLTELYPRLDDPELKERVIFGVSQVGGENARTWLLARARDQAEPVEIRKNALFWVGQMGGLRATDLSDLYGSMTDIEMREQVIFVASQSSEPEAVDFLMDIARNEEDPELNKRALFWLGQSKDPRVAEFLLEIIRGRGPNR